MNIPLRHGASDNDERTARANRTAESAGLGNHGMAVTFLDVTDPKAAADHTTVRTLADEAGNRYVLLTTAQYLRLLMSEPRTRRSELQDEGSRTWSSGPQDGGL
jgi:hypothetical protein